MRAIRKVTAAPIQITCNILEARNICNQLDHDLSPTNINVGYQTRF